MEFIERLNQLMQREGIKTQYKLAQILDIKLNVINNWFRGVVRCPSEKYIKIISEKFNAQPQWLRYGDKQQAPSYTDDIQKIAKKLEEYGKKNPEKLKHKIKIFEILLEEDKFSEQYQPIQKRKQKIA
jgi:hypothetical protein